MKWFKPKFSVCKECGVHYEPVTGNEARWGDLCLTHRKPVMENELRKDAVVSWATLNWKKVEPLYLKERKENEEQFQAAFQKGMNAMARQQQVANLGGYSIGVLGSLGTRFPGSY